MIDPTPASLTEGFADEGCKCLEVFEAYIGLWAVFRESLERASSCMGSFFVLEPPSYANPHACAASARNLLLRLPRFGASLILGASGSLAWVQASNVLS